MTVRMRKQGTLEYNTTTPDECIEAVRTTLKNKQYSKINGVMMDTFSAGAIVAVYDALNDTNKATFSRLPISKMAAVAFKLIK